MTGLFERRVEQEWTLLQDLAAAHPGLLGRIRRRADADGLAFETTLTATPALLRPGAAIWCERTHVAVLHFRRFFPSVPIEASLARPVFHPNVHPGNGFVCLWTRATAGDTAIDALRQLQRVMSWALLNREPDHVMQPDALAWFGSPDRSPAVPLPCELIPRPAAFDLERTYGLRPPTSRRRIDPA